MDAHDELDLSGGEEPPAHSPAPAPEDVRALPPGTSLPFPEAVEPASPLTGALPEGQKPGGRPHGSLFEVAVVVLLALFIALLLKVYVAEAYEIRGKSMEDTFHQDERVMVLKVLYDIRRGDIIIFSSAENYHKDLIKRVIGLPGDTVEVRDGEVFINGKKLEEPYARLKPRHYEYKKAVIQPGKYFVLGDNRPDSQDSRFFDAIDASTIKGKVFLRWWPLEKLGSF